MQSIRDYRGLCGRGVSGEGGNGAARGRGTNVINTTELLSNELHLYVYVCVLFRTREHVFKENGSYYVGCLTVIIQN